MTGTQIIQKQEQEQQQASATRYCEENSPLIQRYLLRSHLGEMHSFSQHATPNHLNLSNIQTQETRLFPRTPVDHCFHNLELSRRSDHDLGSSGSRLRSDTFDGLDNIHALNDLSEHAVLQMRDREFCWSRQQKMESSIKKLPNYSPFRQASWSQQCRGRTDFRWCWVRHWPWTRYQARCASAESSHRQTCFRRWTFLRYRCGW